jgi:cytochrome c1
MPPATTGGDAARGRLLLAQYQCGSCHQIPGVDGARGMTGPALDAFGRRSYVAGFLPNYPDALVRWIVDPPAVKPGTAMPAMGVSAEDARHMAAYLYQLK